MNKLRYFFHVCAAITCVIAFNSFVYAKEESPTLKIVVQGNQRIEEETINSYITVDSLDDITDEEKIDVYLKSLFATGLFSDVSIKRDGDVLLIKVIENPIINRVVFEGNKHIKSKRLLVEAQLKPRSVYTRTKVQNDVNRILSIYRHNGYYAVTVDPKIIEQSQNRVDLVFDIKEGPTAYVRRIHFIGNKAYNSRELREQIVTKENVWYRFFTSFDTYDSDRLKLDRELLRRFYQKNGYVDFLIASSVAELTPNNKSFFITHTIEEGERYKLGKISVKSAIADLNVEELQPTVDELKSGSWYNADEIEDVIQKLTDVVGEKGYAFSDINPELERHRTDSTIDVLFNINDASKIYIERINIRGNQKTRDNVIRRELRIAEGDAFNAAKIRRSRERIGNLDYFENIEFDTAPSENSEDRIVLDFDVVEKSTGNLNVGLGWSSLLGAIIDLKVIERNLLGYGRVGTIGMQLAQRQQGFNLGFTEPYFLNREMMAGANLFTSRNNNQKYSSYDSNTNGLNLLTGWSYNEYLSHEFKYTFSGTRISNVKKEASFYIQKQRGSSLMSAVSHTIMYDRRDSKVDPTSGYSISGGNEFSGLGGNERWIQNSLNASKFFKLSDRVVLMLFAGGSHISSWTSSEVGITHRCYLGEDTMRGFADNGISPRDKNTGDAIGGMWSVVGTTELQFPLGLPQEIGMRGRIFADLGTVGFTDRHVKNYVFPETNGSSKKPEIAQSIAPRMSIGFGVLWSSPIGPLNLDFGWPVFKNEHDRSQVFRFNVGTRF
ncbi:MAG: outer membrane protein assembly factor BamA [Rhodospirillaceae bacterium]|nr:outer membrane protein assembly factor BamA [Rhodospirillaceae bacterium]